MITFRQVDRYQHIYSLRMIREGECLAQAKHDGYFAVIIKDGPLQVISRHQKPLKISKDMLAAIESLNLKDGTVLHGEWTGLRESNREEGLVLFSVTHLKYEWLGGLTEVERFDSLNLMGLNLPPMISIVECTDHGYADMYRRMTKDPRTEGIVLKKKTTKLIGDLRSPKTNPGYFKVKYKEGHEGTTIRIIPDSDLICRED